MNRTDHRFSIALYGTTISAESYAPFVSRMRTLCQDVLGYDIDYFDASIPKKKDKWIARDAWDGKAGRNLSLAQSVALSASSDGKGSKGPLFHFDFYAELDAFRGLTVVSLPSPVIDQCGASVVRQVIDSLRFLRYEYGIGYHRRLRAGPAMYALGCLQSSSVADDPEESYEEELSICRWGDMGLRERVYRMGIIRDVYPHNLISDKVLSKPIAGMPLKQWILSNAQRGRLTDVGDGMQHWEVPDQTCKYVATDLKAAGIVFDWRECAKQWRRK